VFVATVSRPLATTITGSLPRPSWYVQNLGTRPFLTAFNGDALFREQYVDAVAASISDQTRAGLDIVTDGEMRFDADIGGRSWFGYLFDRMEGLAPNTGAASRELGTPRPGFRARASMPGDILAEFVQTLRPPQVVAPVKPGVLQYDAVWKVAQKMTDRPVKFGSCCGQMIERQSENQFYKDRREAVFAFSDALNAEYHRLADAGCQVIQVEEPCLHGSAGVQQEIPFEIYIEAFNREVKGLRAKTEVWCHTCWEIRSRNGLLTVRPIGPRPTCSRSSTSTSSRSRRRRTPAPTSPASPKSSAGIRSFVSACSVTGSCRSSFPRRLRA
jgi:5-methyltetrahydropteroyltriglutamate--homocysteine methyltransferase